MKPTGTQGFSLVELSLVLAIIGVVTATGIGLGSSALKGATRVATQERLAAIKTALNQFALQNGYLPCPADRTLTPGSANYGVEQRAYSGTGYTSAPTATPSSGSATFATSVSGGALTAVTVTNPGSGYGAAPSITLSGGGGSGASATASIVNGAVAYVTVPSCNTATTVLSGTTYIGMVPVRTLGLPDSFAADAWNDKLTYAANANLTVGPGSYAKPVVNGPQVYYGVKGSLQLASRAPATDGTPANGVVAFVVVSHGASGAGAYPVDSGAVPTACGTSTTDAENCNDDATFIDGLYADGTQTSSFFDDYVVWDTNNGRQATLLPTPSGCPSNVCESWCAPCFTNFPASASSLTTAVLCSKIITSTSPSCQATCLWSGTLISSGRYQPCP